MEACYFWGEDFDDIVVGRAWAGRGGWGRGRGGDDCSWGEDVALEVEDWGGRGGVVVGCCCCCGDGGDVGGGWLLGGWGGEVWVC